MLAKIYLKRLFFLFSIIFIMTAIYSDYFATHYPMPLTNHISFDAKLKFVHDKINADEIDTLIIGSSLGLNNINGEVLEKNSKKCHKVLNLSAYGVSTLEAEQLLGLRKAFPKLKRILYSGQYSDFAHGNKYFEIYEPKTLIKYMRGEHNIFEFQWLAFKACQDLLFCVKRQNTWVEEHNQSNKFTYLGFDTTGSVPLSIYGDDIIGHRWRNPQPGIMHPNSFMALERMSIVAKDEGLDFYFIHQPYREGLAKLEKVQNILTLFIQKAKKAIEKNNGIFIGLHEKLGLKDSCFADRTHLNGKASIITAKVIGKIIDESRTKL